MKKTCYTEEQIAFALRQAETGTPVGEVIRKVGISTQTFYRWKKQYGQMGVDGTRRLKQLEEENRKIEAWRRHYNESRPHNALGDVPPSEFASKSGVSPALAGSARPGIFTP